jgi:hypothetical protein
MKKMYMIKVKFDQQDSLIDKCTGKDDEKNGHYLVQ